MTLQTETIKKLQYVKVGEIIEHPTFGPIKVTFISKRELGHDIFCELLHYNGAIKVLDYIDLARVKYKIVSLRLVK